MAEQSGFFDAHLVDGEYDRVYLAASFAKYFASFIGNGIFAGKSSELIVRQKSSANMSVRVLAGQGWINGYWYENTDELSLAIDIADGVLNRIDIVVLRWDSSERVIRLAVKKGIPATNPTAPTVQRDADNFELKLAQIYIKAGATGITQIDISDTRLDSAVCGFVHGVVEQLDAQEFGEQLDAFIQEFMTEHTEWSTQFKANSNKSVNDLLVESQGKVNKLISDGQTSFNNAISAGQTSLNKTASDGQAKIDKVATDGQTSINTVVEVGRTNLAKVASDGQTSIDNVVNTGTANINKLISDKTAEANQVVSQGRKNFEDLNAESTAWFNQFKEESEAEVIRLVAELEDIIETNDVSALNLKITKVAERVTALEAAKTTIESDITELKKLAYLKDLFIKNESNPGCYYRTAANGEIEWVNPPNEPGIEYRTTERWNGKPVYQKLFYVGSLPNKTVMSIFVNAYFNKIVSTTGFAVDSDNNLYYPFPIILNGLTPVAVISNVEGDGGAGSYITINTNDDISAFVGYVLVKYYKD